LQSRIVDQGSEREDVLIVEINPPGTSLGCHAFEDRFGIIVPSPLGKGLIDHRAARAGRVKNERLANVWLGTAQNQWSQTANSRANVLITGTLRGA